ncbi:MAG: hypothetical protein WCQ99_08650 [Pseudomonadota bacterium]
MGNLTTYLQSEIPMHVPDGWICSSEVPVLPQTLTTVLGYSARADILLERQVGERNIWIEFEVSRADPVANHAKFATAHLFQPQRKQDVFISMVSSHVTRGRRNLAANTITLMREIGMNAFQTVLLPKLSPFDIKRINHLESDLIALESLNITAELTRAISISEAVIDLHDKCLHFASDFLEVFLNLRQWNNEIKNNSSAEKWGQRTITYFVFDPYSKKFAPSKFCAYIFVNMKPDRNLNVFSPSSCTMTIDSYTALDGSDRRFDGRSARMHLTEGLGMLELPFTESSLIATMFEKWLKAYKYTIHVHPKGPIFLLPPVWLK